MFTKIYECGCSVTNDMHTHKILFFNLCSFHRECLQDDLIKLDKKLHKIIDMENETLKKIAS